MSSSQENKKIGCFDNSYARLPESFYERIRPDTVEAPKLIRLNDELAEELQLDLKQLSEKELAALFAGNALFEGSEPLAQVYSGHQFGHFVPQLGDGRAVLLGEVLGKNNKRYDVQLKGSGRTRFSRAGDGKAALGPVIREYIISEAMYRLGIPTTRSLAMVTTGEEVFREIPLPGGVLTRVASSHIRVGTFEYFASRGDRQSVQRLADYVIERHYPEVKSEENVYLSLFRRILEGQASLIAKWMGIAFIHGVMNTDNCAISGETIDYGPCAFMDEYDPQTVFSSIDRHGRYAYGNQGSIAQWNLTKLAECLLFLFAEHEERALELAKEVLLMFPERYEEEWSAVMLQKIGIESTRKDDVVLLQDLLALMQANQADFTLTFRYLCDMQLEEDKLKKFDGLFSESEAVNNWLKRWRVRLSAEKKSAEDIQKMMLKTNPAFIPRNHRVEQAIEAAVYQNDFSKVNNLIEILNTPFKDQPQNVDYMKPPKPDERVKATFCGT